MAIDYETCRIVFDLDVTEFEALTDTLLEFLHGAPDEIPFSDRKNTLRGIKVYFYNRDGVPQAEAKIGDNPYMG